MALRARILDRLSGVPPVGTEDAALRLLALRASEPETGTLLREQRTCGGWGAFAEAGPPNAYHTALALLALRGCPRSHTAAAERALDWLAELRGLELHWLWQWKFRWFDRQVRFDPRKSGWPWVAGTVSWVAPTALAILAFRAWGRAGSPRVSQGIAMLFDRQCPRGGWNAGNSVAFGVELDPHPDFTAMAALALHRSAQSADRRALDYLADRLKRSESPYSLAWSAMSLAAYGHPAALAMRNRLIEAAAPPRLTSMPARVLSLTALALEDPPFAFDQEER